MGAYLCGRNSDTNGQHVNLIDTVAAVVTIPFVSALLAYGAAAHVERKNGKQKLTMRQLLGLADRNWVTMDPTHLHRAPGDRSAFLYIATLFILISAIQLPLRTYLAPIGSRPAIAADEFPSNCPGQFPFLTDYTGNGISIRVCVPDGKDGKPWGAMRDRQDIEEEMYLDARLASDAGDATLNDDFQNLTILCVGRSTMGYFELGNLHNQEQPSELLAQWLDPDETDDFDDYFAESPLTSDSNYDRRGTASSPSGPLQMAAEVLFGPQSYQHTLFQLSRSTETSISGSLCSAPKPPMAGIDYPGPPAWVESMAKTCNATSVSKESLTTEAYSFVRGFLSQESGSLALGVAMYLANEALLTSVDTDRAYGLRRIVDKPPVNFRGVDVSHASMIAVSVLLGVQVLLLIHLTQYTYTLGKGAGKLDASSILRMGAAVEG
ncbi:hypothetical protein HYQ44_006236 [Verticillium longisporum]|nr:hypothetical protein HYQ44_006236 [Verticillium longisporum]